MRLCHFANRRDIIEKESNVHTHTSPKKKKYNILFMQQILLLFDFFVLLLYPKMKIYFSNQIGMAISYDPSMTSEIFARLI